MNNTVPVGASISSISSAPSWFSIIIIVGMMAVVISVFTIAMSSVTRYKKIKGVLLWLALTLNYFLIGVGTLLALAVPGMVIFYFGKQAVEGNTVPLWITASLIVGYFVIALIGWVSKKLVVDRIKLFEEEIKKDEVEDGQWVK